MVNVLITGSKGFIGGNLKQLLTNENIPFKEFSGNCTSREDWKNNLLYDDFSHVVHCAGYNGGISFNGKNPADIYTQNTQMILAALEACKNVGITHFLTFVTSCGYDDIVWLVTDNKGYSESRYLDGKPHRSVLAHGLAKRNVLRTCNFYQQQYDINTLCLCPNTVYGPGDRTGERAKVMMALIEKAALAKQNGDDHVVIWGDGKQTREFIYVYDLMKVVLKAIKEEWDTIYQHSLINIGPATSIGIRHLMETICEVVGFEGDILHDVSKPVGASSKDLDYALQNRLHLNTEKTQLIDGIRETVEWYQKTLNPSAKES